MSLPVGGVEGNDDVQSVRLLLDYELLTTYYSLLTTYSLLHTAYC